MKYILPILLIGFLFTACKNETAPEKTKMPPLYDKVMEVHDEVMPRMSDIMTLKKELRKHLTNEEKKTVILDQIKVLDDADKAMMDWMGALNVPKTEPKRTEYLEGQLKEIEMVRDAMLSSIETGDALLNSLNETK